MRIAVYKDNLSTGRGADSAVRNFAAGLGERGHDVALMEKADFFARVLGTEGGAGADDFNVIVATGSNEIVDLDMAGYFSRPHRAKVVLQLHLAPRGFFKWKHPIRNRRIRDAFDKPDAVQLLCSSYEAEFRRMAPHPRIFIIGNHAPLSLQPPVLDSQSPIRNSHTILYPAATVNRVKNQKLLIEAFALIAGEFPEWNMRLLGKNSTPYAASCRRLIAHKGLASRIELVGFTCDLVSEYASAAFIAFPSTLEGFPLAVLEAAQFALPAVAQKGLPGVSDIIHDGETGVVADASISAYAAELRRLMSDETLRRRLGENARRFCAERYSREQILDQWENLFAQLK
jgi:glycosyltransferase involved in cell wall biosynthesis